ncbi:DUF5107 domain-containing protein [Lacrimispora saccharolytica]|uniref:DUF5107 domain-containing protein n=1 Tax=Lacrimispora saccharolytica (strain ATCC 35040 / DSM 2544 / NRCC 2533 / WM1) TaxID=610130 RepID=D9R1G9_LACSW|nr:DUF5107 domain-containing protein [Lacrimispora saccharolytica]ADL06492.1 conserved hypothetical protein [[Clostridium] saccharolyticum WM1]QRV19426.1 DUF5107 domain-containing protein [Lacrimispora saccharolytica]
MEPQLTFSEISMEVSDLGPDSALPDILGELNIQNKVKSILNEYEEIYEGYGQLQSVYPYRLQNTYNRKLKPEKVPVAVLENEYLKATFLPTYGGRLWSFIDKQTGTNLLYTNDVIRPSNLALRNAWFSGGVEWNIGMIGHHPFTMSQVFTAELSLEDGTTPVLRFYEFERIRKTAYQIDFWLEKESRYLNCRMRIHNQNEQVVPMYWWSNMAVPEYPGGRVIVPAQEAYTNTNGIIEKVSIPYVRETDVTAYGNIETQVDYFFDIPEKELKFIANVNQEGYGLVQMSTNRLRGRKLFCWGKNEGSDRWQEFLTKEAGRYVEIQAGLGKTQYGCIPMAPNTAWEWIEQYGPVRISKDTLQDFSSAQKAVGSYIRELAEFNTLEEKLIKTRQLAKTEGTVIYRGSGYGRLENRLREERHLPPLAPQLDFSSPDTRQKEWEDFLQWGKLSSPDPMQVPEDYILDDYLYQRLSDYVREQDSHNWYAWLHLGFHAYYSRDFSKAKKNFLNSDNCSENPWAKLGLAAVYRLEEDRQNAVSFALEGMKLCRNSLSYAKDVFKLLNNCGAYGEMKELYLGLPDPIVREGRIRLYYIIALKELEEFDQAYELLMENGGLIVEDIREGEDSIGTLWQEIYRQLYPEGQEKLPHVFCFKSFS